MERILQRKYYNFDSIKNIIRCKGYLVSISDRWERSNFKRGTYNTVFPVTWFYKICSLPVLML